MGRGKETKASPDPKIHIQERGEIYFFYRPKVDKEEVHGADDVQRLYIVLLPESGKRAVEEKQSPDSGKEGQKRSKEKKDDSVRNSPGKEKPEGGHGSEEVNMEKKTLFRFMVMGRKKIPDPSHRSRPSWGFVEMVTTKAEDVRAALKGEEYDTATRGHRRQSPARVLAEGTYRILKHQSGRGVHTHLIYKLELPAEDKLNEPQEELNVEHEGSFIIQIKNPEQSGGGFRGLQGKRRAAFPASLQSSFGKRRYAPADPPDFLNYEGCEFLLISASDDIEKLGLHLVAESESEPGKKVWESSCSDFIKPYAEDGGKEDAVEFKPLFRGAWV